MGRQLRFYATTHDVADLWQALTMTDASLVLIENKHLEGDSIRPCQVPESMSVRSQSLLVTTSSNVSKLLWVGPNEIKHADLIESPAIELTLGISRAETLGRSRFYYAPSFVRSGKIIQKAEEFLEIAASVMRHSRRLFSRNMALDAYFGKEADVWLKTVGDFDVLPGGRIVSRQRNTRTKSVAP